MTLFSSIIIIIIIIIISLCLGHAVTQELNPPPVTFLRTATTGRINVYRGGVSLRSEQWPVVWSPSVLPDDVLAGSTMLIESRGVSTRLVVPSNSSQPTSSGAPPVWVVTSDGRSPLTARWRHLHLNNHSLHLTNVPVIWPGGSTLVRLRCRPNKRVFCDAGPVSFQIPLGNGTSVSLAYSLWVDPSRSHGRLPALIYMTLHRRRQCVSLKPPLIVCPADLPLFDLASDSDASVDTDDVDSPLILGGLFWRIRVQHTHVDQWTGDVTLQMTATAPSDGLRLAGAILGFLFMILLYAWLWVTNWHSVLSYYRYFESAAAGADLGRVETNARQTGAHYVLPLATATGLSFAWIAQAQFVPLPTLLAAPNMSLLLIFLTIYASLEMAIATLIFLVDEIPVFCRGSGRMTYHIPLVHAWLRNGAYGTAVLTASALCFWPEVLKAATSGDRIVILILLLILNGSLLTHIYYAPFLITVVARDAKRVWVRVLAIVQLLLVVPWAGVLVWFFLAPALTASSSYFSDVACYMAAVLLTGLGLLMPLALLASEVKATGIMDRKN